MSLIKWKRNKGLFPEMSSMVEDFFRDSNDFFPMKSNALTVPAINVAETDGSYNLEVAAPGLKKEDFKISVDNGVLMISSEKEMKKEEEEEGFTRKEFSYSSFSRSFWLPESVKDDAIEAKYEDGVLKIMIPKTEVKKVDTAKTIEIS